MRAGRNIFSGAESGCVEACPRDVAGVRGAPPPAAFSAPYRGEGPAGSLKAILLSESQIFRISPIPAASPARTETPAPEAAGPGRTRRAPPAPPVPVHRGGLPPQ